MKLFFFGKRSTPIANLSSSRRAGLGAAEPDWHFQEKPIAIRNTFCVS
jgi:hypothetical protein